MTDQPTITLAQWCAYLPYGITLNINGEKFILNAHLLDVMSIDLSVAYNAKPLLRPMNKVNEEHINELLGAKFAFENGLLFDYNEGHWSGLKTNDLPYLIIQKLLAAHYDIFNLIPQGLALPIE